MLVRRLHGLANSAQAGLYFNSYVLSRTCCGNGRYFSRKSERSDDDHEKVNNENSQKVIEMVVTSLRVDRVAASGLGLARRKVDNSLLAGRVYLNGNKVNKKSRQVTDGDVIDRVSEKQPKSKEVRFGQVKVMNIGELTKKGNYHISIMRNKAITLPVDEFWESHN